MKLDLIIFIIGIAIAIVNAVPASDERQRVKVELLRENLANL